MNPDRNDLNAPGAGGAAPHAPSFPPPEEGLRAHVPWSHRWTQPPEVWRDEDEPGTQSDRAPPGAYGLGAEGPIGPVGAQHPPALQSVPSIFHRRSGLAGVAPRNYRRPDARVFEDVCDALTAHDAIDPSEVEVRVEGGVVTLSGAVEDRAMRHLLEVVAGRVPGVREVRLRVALSPTRR